MTRRFSAIGDLNRDFTSLSLEKLLSALQEVRCRVNPNFKNLQTFPKQSSASLVEAYKSRKQADDATSWLLQSIRTSVFILIGSISKKLKAL